MKLKNLAVVLVVAVILCSIGTSCKKCYACYFYGQTRQIYCQKDYSASELNTFDTICIQGGGVWSTYQQ